MTDDVLDRNAAHLGDTRDTLSAIDRDYASVGCLGVGGFGCVFLATKNSGRHVALKVMPMDTSDDEQYDAFTREVESVAELNKGDGGNGDRDLGIVQFEDWHVSSNFVCIVMQYADGGTLAQEIERRAKHSPVEPYAERRIAWYALQLCDALAFAHEKGVAHHDVKAANVLIDASAGGKLLLADFGTSLKPGEESVGFTKSYAPPELLASHEIGDYANLRPDMIDSFALGAVLWELLHVCRLEDLSTDQTLAQFISDGPGLEAAMNMPTMMRLPWLGNGVQVGYSQELKNLVMSLLKGAHERLLPSQMRDALRHDPLSPLLLPKLSAAQAATPGAPVTIDNLQLGMLVQRGLDWSDEDDDGGINSIGVVVKLDGDATYCEAAFPSRTSEPIEMICCRIGASNKYELQVGPQVPDFTIPGSTSLRHDGLVHVGAENVSNYSLGQWMNSNCMIVGADQPRGVVFAAPIDRYPIPSLPPPVIWRTDKTSFAEIHEDLDIPSSWQSHLGTSGSFVNVLGMAEGKVPLDLFYDRSSGLRRGWGCPVQSIKRVQDDSLWASYAQRRAKVASENWGIDNEIRAFLVHDNLSRSNLCNFSSAGKQFSTKASIIHNKFNRRSSNAEKQMILCRIAVGRVLEEDEEARPTTTYHSKVVEPDLYECRGAVNAYPEYVITYKDSTPSALPPVNSTSGASQGTPGRSESKMCIICIERPVRYICVPCGHPCLCEECNKSHIKAKLRGKCPECRARFRSTTIIYGRVVNDE